MLVHWLLAVALWCQANARKSPPHIILILADDLGWNDVSFHGSGQIPTPNIDALASDGIVLNNYYSLPLCSPSRAALMSGRYPLYLGLQRRVILPGEHRGLSPDVVTLAEHLQRRGYTTRMVGKWHLGYFKKEYTPTYQGFDSFFGFWNSHGDYFDHTLYQPIQWPTQVFMGLDLHDNLTIVRDKQGYYRTTLFTDKAVDIIKTHNSRKPLFLFLSHQAVHTGNTYKYFQVPPKYRVPFDYIQNPDRNKYAGMVSSMDQSIGKVFKALSDAKMLSNSIVIFTTDNGGDWHFSGGVASNWPLRGSKGTLWEGGVRVNTVLWSPLLKKKPRVSMQMMHVVDWLPTLYHAAGGKVRDLGKIDGIDMWNAISWDLPSPRQEILLNVDPIQGTQALRRKEWKVISGSYNDGQLDTWFGASGHHTSIPQEYMDQWVFLNGSLVGAVLKSFNGKFPPSSSDWRLAAKVKCGPIPFAARLSCNPMAAPCLFNVTDDPCEYKNIAAQYPEVVKDMLRRITMYNKTSVSPSNTILLIDPLADPDIYDFSYVPWMDERFTSVVSSYHGLYG